MFLTDRLSEYALYLPSDCDRKCQTLRVEGFGGAGDIENPEQLAVNGVPNRSGCARPSLGFAAEVLDTMDLGGLQCCDGGSDRVGSDVRFGPSSTLLEVYDTAEICGSGISRGLNNHSRWICQDDDGTRFSEEETRLLQGWSSCRN